MAVRKPITPEMIEANKYIIDEYFDPDFGIDMVEHLMQHIDRLYFRSEFIGFDPLPERNDPERPLIFCSNHSGNAFPWDAIVFVAMLAKRANYNFRYCVRALTAPMLSMSTLMNPFLVENFWKRGGGIDATFLNFSTMMHNPEANVLIFPEGVPGIGKGFNKRYQLQRFSSSFVRHAIKYRTDIIPYSTVNGEYINPYNMKSDLINRIVQKFGIPFIPVGIMTLLVPFQPWLFYFGFPCKMYFVMGKRIKAYEMIDKPYEEITEAEFREITDKIQRQMQEELNEAVKKYGRKPYQVKELFARWRQNWRKFPFFIPIFWPSLFLEFDRLSRKGRVQPLRINIWNGLKAHLKNPISFAFYIPLLGWIPILIRGYRERRDFQRKEAENRRNRQ